MARTLVPTQLASDVRRGEVITPAPRVEIHQDGVLDEAILDGEVTVRLADPQGATLSGTLTRAPVGGVAVFDDLAVDRAGSYELLADCDEDSLVYPGWPDDGIGINPNLPGIVALYDAQFDGTIRDRFSQWPHFLANPGYTYGLYTPIGLVGLRGPQSPLYYTGHLATPIRVVPESGELTILALAEVSAAGGIYSLWGYQGSGGSRQIRFEAGEIASGSLLQSRMTVHDDSGYTALYCGPARSVVGWHLFTYRFRVVDGRVWGQSFLDKNPNGAQAGPFPAPPGSLCDELGTELPRPGSGTQTFAQMAIVHRALTDAEIEAQVDRCGLGGVAP